MDQELTQEEVQKIRAEEAAAVFGEKTTPVEEQPTEGTDDDGADANAEGAETGNEGEGTEDDTDPWEGVSPAVKARFDEQEKRLKAMDELTNRLKQAESRVGAMQNEFYKQKKEREEAAKKKAKEPTPEEVAEEKRKQEEWDGLKSDPDSEEIVRAIDDQLSLKTGRIDKELTELKGAIQKLSETERTPANVNEVAALQRTVEELRISLVHKDWEQTIKSDDYTNWLKTADKELQDLHFNGEKASDAIRVLNAFEDHRKAQKPSKTAAEIKAEREQRLEKSGKPEVRGARPVKRDEDMTDEEFRRKAEREIFGDT